MANWSRGEFDVVLSGIPSTMCTTVDQIASGGTYSVILELETCTEAVASLVKVALATSLAL